MRNLKITTFIFLTLLFSCKKEDTPDMTFEKNHIEMHQEDEKVSKEMHNFKDVLNKLYNESEKNPNKVLLEIDSLFNVNQNETDKYKCQIKKYIADDLRSFKAELLYNIGEYNKSIKELKIGTSHHDEIGLICNYVKIKKFDKAKRILDSIPNYTFNTFIYANFYETIGKKDEALKIYKTIQKDKGENNCIYYEMAVQRIKELEKQNSVLLKSVYYETGKPDFKACDSDNVNRTKVIELVRELPEVKDKFEKNAGIGILEAPLDNGKNYYWVRFYEDNSSFFKTEYNFFVYQNTFEIKYYDKKNNRLLSLEEWRK